MHQKTGNLKVDLSKYTASNNRLELNAGSYFTNRAADGANFRATPMERFQIPKEAKPSTPLPKKLGVTPRTSKKHRSSDRIAQEGKISLERPKSNKSSSRNLKLPPQEMTKRSIRPQTPKQILKLENRQNSVLSINKLQTKRLTLRDREADIKDDSLAELQKLVSKLETRSRERFDILVERQLKQSNCVEVASGVAYILQKRLRLQRHNAKAELDKLRDTLKGKDVQLLNRASQQKSLKDKLQRAEARIRDMAELGRQDRSTRPTYRNNYAQTSGQVTSDQYKDCITYLNAELKQSQQKADFYERMLCLIKKEHDIDFNEIYQQAQENEEIASRLPLPNHEREKILVNVENDCSAQADISRVNDSDESSFNFVGKTEQDKASNTKQKGLIEGRSKLQRSSKPSFMLNLSKLDRYSPDSRSD